MRVVVVMMMMVMIVIMRVMLGAISGSSLLQI